MLAKLKRWWRTWRRWGISPWQVEADLRAVKREAARLNAETEADRAFRRQHGLPTPAEEAESLVVEFELPAGATDADVIAAAKDAALLADDLHRAAGGNGLKVESVKIREE